MKKHYVEPIVILQDFTYADIIMASSGPGTDWKRDSTDYETMGRILRW